MLGFYPTEPFGPWWGNGRIGATLAASRWVAHRQLCADSSHPQQRRSIGAFDLNSPINAALVLPDCRHWFSNVNVRTALVLDTRRRSLTTQRDRSTFMADDGLSQLTDDEKTALLVLLKRTINDDRYPLSPRIGTLRDILAKLQPPPSSPAPLPPLRRYAPPRATARQRRASC